MKHPMQKYLRLARRYLPLVQGFVALVKLECCLRAGPLTTMHSNYSYKFVLPNGKIVHVQSNTERDQGKQLVRWILQRWRPPKYFFHLLHRGGHVAAAGNHVSSSLFCRLDIEDFYGSISRSKIHRALKKLRFKHLDAQEFARNCTVTSSEGRYRYSLPFGFVQSPIIASLVLDKSALGNCFRKLQQQGIRISIYVDDILISEEGSGPKILEASNLVAHSAMLSDFRINSDKRQEPAESVQIFNLLLSFNNLCVTEYRMNKFRHALNLNRHNPNSVAAIIAYVRSVNDQQANSLTDFAGTL